MPHYDIFLSHSSQDKAYVDVLRKRLRDRGYRVWYDETHISWGNDLQNTIEEGLRNSYYGIVVLSRHYLANRRWTTFEFDRIKDGRVLPLLYKITIDEIETKYPNIHENIREIRAISSEPGLDYVLSEVDQVIGNSIVGQKPEFKKLRNLLATREWKYADRETLNLVNQKGGILRILHEDLNNLDGLWFIYSDQRYGFRIQQEIYQSCCQPSKGYLQYFYRFCDCVGWGRTLGNVSEYNLHPDTLKGNLPALAYSTLNSPDSKLLLIWFVVLIVVMFIILIISVSNDAAQVGAGLILLWILFWSLVGLVVGYLSAKLRTRRLARNLYKFFTSSAFNL